MADGQTERNGILFKPPPAKAGGVNRRLKVALRLKPVFLRACLVSPLRMVYMSYSLPYHLVPPGETFNISTAKRLTQRKIRYAAAHFKMPNRL